MTQSQSARVWASRAFMDSSRIRLFTADPLPTGMDLGQMAELNETGERMSAEHFPKQIFAEYPDKKEKKQADLVLAAGAVVVSAICADVLRQFDLGHSSLYPIKLLQHDRKTPVEGEYFCLNIGERKDTFLRKHSPLVKEFGDKTMMMPSWLQDGDVAVSPAALEGPDLWVSPPLIRIFFLSDRLTQALRAAKMARVFGFRACRIVEAD
ncbi:imm11 family protein [Mesorhizobium newzealandense]|uniref:Imm11 family protein n=1 Tax=Mesorhizobium newzealandense TaxID=1300302 RepID=A0ABW4U790_9HYPH